MLAGVNDDSTLRAYESANDAFAATGGPAFCSDSSHSQCAGTYDAISAAVDWRFAPKWDVYFGMMFNQVHGGLNFGFFQHSNIDPTVGLRFRF